MGAGLSKKQFNDRIYKRLKSTQRQLEKAGVKTHYKNYQLCADLTGRTDDGTSFNISYGRINASNGECAGIPNITVLVRGVREHYGFWNSPNGDFDKGIARIVELLGPTKQTPDFFVQNEGTIFLLHPLSEAAKAWVSEHIPEDAQYFGSAVVVEHRFVENIIQGIQQDGLTIE